MSADLQVSEVFGPTFQGEGPSAGRRAVFVRLGLCNLDCRWCDTPYTWDWKGKNGPPQDRTKLAHREAIDVYGEVMRRVGHRGGIVVITGGEPLVQRSALDGLVALLMGGPKVGIEVETNGTIAPPLTLCWPDIGWNVSPKLAHSGVARDLAVKPAVLHQFVELGAVFKFVCTDESDLDEIDRLRCTVGIPASRVWVMPEGRTAEAITAGLQRLADPALSRGFNLTSRLHVLVWGDERGR